MTASLYLMGAKNAGKTAVEFNEAFKQQALAQLQSGALELQMQEIEDRTKMQLQNIYRQSEKVVASQEAAFTAAGVELSGSAMSVISDTLNDAAQAAYIRQREADYDLMGVGMEKFHYDQMGSNETLMLNLAAAGVNGVAGLAGDMKAHKQSNTRNRGSFGLGDSYAKQDAFGGTTGYSRAYMEM